VLKALRGIDCYLLVAPTKGINVWCAACGGHFTENQIISVLKTSGIADIVDHRTLIIPPLSAAGVDRKSIRDKTGWNGIFGPVDCKDLPAFIKDHHKTERMRRVTFPLNARLEIAIMWASSISIIAGVVLAIGWRHLLLPMLILIWAMSFTLFIFLFQIPGKINLLKAFKVGILYAILILLLEFVRGDLSVKSVIGGILAPLALSLVMGIDMAGSTPLFKTDLHKGEELYLNRDLCDGCAICWDICPKRCFKIDAEEHKVAIVAPEECERCSACVKQCPRNALELREIRGVLSNLINSIKR